MSLKVKLYALLGCLIAVGISTEYLVNMYTISTSVIVDEAMSKLASSGMDHVHYTGHRRGDRQPVE